MKNKGFPNIHGVLIKLRWCHKLEEVFIMKTLKLSVGILTLIILSACAQMNASLIAPTGIANNDHEALAHYYETVAEEARSNLQKNKRILAAYEDRPYYYGRRGLDLQSHTSANIRAHEKTLQESLRFAEFHKRMATKQRDDSINKAKVRSGPKLALDDLE